MPGCWPGGTVGAAGALMAGVNRLPPVGLTSFSVGDGGAALGGRRVLEQVAVDSRPEALQHVLGVVVHAEDEHADGGRATEDLTSGLDAVEQRHPDVENRDIRVELDGLSNGQITPRSPLSTREGGRLQLS